ncbi:MAG TPA: hypothetical protein VET90_02520, partial [Candidatus Binatus sp.]|nr:hypothetical protein [Candidatus Binatus sp.]
NGSPQLTTPSISPCFVTAEGAAGGAVELWDRGRSLVLGIDALAADDPGFLSGTRLAGDLLVWFYTSSPQGGGTREIRWLATAAPFAGPGPSTGSPGRLSCGDVGPAPF